LPEPWRSLAFACGTVAAAFYFAARLLGRATPDALHRQRTNSALVAVGWAIWSALADAVVFDRVANTESAVAMALTGILVAMVVAFVCAST